MSFFIEDGKGTGRKASVDPRNRILTASVSVEEVTHIASLEAGSYQLHFERTVTASNSYEIVGHLKYLGEHKLQVASITMSREDVALNTGSQAVVELMSKTTRVSGGDAVTPINMKVNSPKQLTVEAHSGTTTLVIDQSNKAELLDAAFTDVHVQDFHGSIILEKNDEISLIGKSKNIGDIIHGIVFIYEVTSAI